MQILFTSVIQYDGFGFEIHDGLAMFNHKESSLFKVNNLHGLLEDTSNYFASRQQCDALYRVTRIEYFAPILACDIV
jgi:hypothetical protein